MVTGGHWWSLVVTGGHWWSARSLACISGRLMQCFGRLKNALLLLFSFLQFVLSGIEKGIQNL